MNSARKGCFKCGNCASIRSLSLLCTGSVLTTEIFLIVSTVGHHADSCTATERLCYNCRQPGHESAACPSPRSVSAKQCYSCGGVGHIQVDCPTLRIQSMNTSGAQKCYVSGSLIYLRVILMNLTALWSPWTHFSLLPCCHWWPAQRAHWSPCSPTGVGAREVLPLRRIKSLFEVCTFFIIDGMFAVPMTVQGLHGPSWDNRRRSASCPDLRAFHQQEQNLLQMPSGGTRKHPTSSSSLSHIQHRHIDCPGMPPTRGWSLLAPLVSINIHPGAVSRTRLSRLAPATREIMIKNERVAVIYVRAC